IGGRNMTIQFVVGNPAGYILAANAKLLRQTIKFGPVSSADLADQAIDSLPSQPIRGANGPDGAGGLFVRSDPAEGNDDELVGMAFKFDKVAWSVAQRNFRDIPRTSGLKRMHIVRAVRNAGER